MAYDAAAGAGDWLPFQVIFPWGVDSRFLIR